MGIVNKIQLPKQEEPTLSIQELEFILVKLREAPYKGFEFEMYFKIYKKLVDGIKALE